MKQTLLILCASVFTFINAQNALNIVIFAEDGDPFFVYANGIKQNAEAQSNVRVTGLAPNVSLRIEFANKTLPVIKQNTYDLALGMEHTFKIKRTRKQELVMRYFSQVPLAEGNSGAAIPSVAYHETESPSQSAGYNTNSQSGAAITGGSNSSNDGNVSLSLQLGNVGFQVNVKDKSNSNSNSNTSGAAIDASQSQEVLTVVEEMPEAPGGLNSFSKYISQSLIYPVKARERGSQGKVFLKFVVEMDGSIGDVVIIKGIPGCPECDQEAQRVLKQYPYKWIPGKNNGRPARVYYNLPIVFKIDDNFNSNTTDLSNQNQTGTSQAAITNGSNAQSPSNSQAAIPKGKNGCSAPMSADAFSKLKNAVEQKPFSDTRMSTAKIATKNNCLSTNQIFEICKLFSMDDDKLKYAQFAYDFCSDKANYYTISEVFAFSTTQEKFNTFLDAK